MAGWTSQPTPTFRFRPFSQRQKIVLTWWTRGSPYRHYDGIVADGSIRSGKTLSMSLSFVMWAMAEFGNRNFAMCGKTISALRRNVIIDLKSMLAARGYVVQERRGDNLLIVRYGGAENYFYLFGGKDESSQDLIQGITLAGVYFDEVALMPESFVNQATARCSVEGSKQWFNCNPDSRMHWFKTGWINRYEERRLVYLHFTMDDNLSLSDDKKASYRRQYTGMFYRRYIDGLWVSAEGVIFDMWDPAANTFEDEEMPTSARCLHYVAVDYGTTNPMVFLDAWDDGTNFWIADEYYWDSRKEQRQKTDAEYADDLERFIGYDHGATIIVDPSALSFKVELRNRGYRVKDADNTVLDGIRVTSTMISSRRLRVHRERCKNFQIEITSYVWDEKALERGVEQPIKQLDHAMDAARYLCKTLVTRRRLAA